MDFNDIIASIAFGVGFIMMYQDVQRADELDERSKTRILMSVLASMLWFTYQSRKHGMNASTMYTGIGLSVQLYLLNKILLKEKIRK